MKKLLCLGLLSSVISMHIFADDLSLDTKPNQQNSQLVTADYAKKKLQNNNCMLCGYNCPGGVNICNYNVFINTSLIYWLATQDAMSLGRQISSPTFNGFVNDSMNQQNFSFEPGFKVGLGIKSNDWDNWGGFVQYTRLHGSYDTSIAVPADKLMSMQPWINNQVHTTVSAFTSTWKNELDVINGGIFRTYHVGSRLLFTTSYGIRGGWLNQTLDFLFTVLNLPAGLTNPIPGNNKSNSWFVGPKASIDTNWQLNRGFSLVGNIGTSICYQNYTITHFADETDTVGGLGISTKDSYGQLRPYLELQSGLAWGTYARDEKIYINFQATYDFMVWFQQNAIRALADLSAFGNDTLPGNLYFQGLTFSGQIDF